MALDRAAFAFAHLDLLLCRYDHIEDPVLHSHGLDTLLEIMANLILVARVAVDHIPGRLSGGFRRTSHPERTGRLSDPARYDWEPERDPEALEDSLSVSAWTAGSPCISGAGSDTLRQALQAKILRPFRPRPVLQPQPPISANGIPRQNSSRAIWGASGDSIMRFLRFLIGMLFDFVLVH